MTENQIATIIVDCAYKIHSRLGPGLLESVYETVFVHELIKNPELIVVRQQPIPFEYEGIRFDEGFRADLVVGNKVIIELKSVEKIMPVHQKQLLTYLRLSGLKLGLLVNFGAPLIKDGITRIINGYFD
jgi:GxxExxY protein